MKKLLDNGDTITLLGVQKSLLIRHINHTEVLLFSSVTLVVLALVFSSLIVLHNNKIIKFVWGFVGLYILAVVFIGFKDVYSLPLHNEQNPVDLLRIFYMCDAIIISFGYALKVSYEAINIITFVVVQPLLIIYLIALLIHRKYRTNNSIAG